jgi:hypothetical protein
MLAVVHRDTPRGLRVRLEGADHDEWIVGCADPEAVLATLGWPPSRLTLAAPGRATLGVPSRRWVAEKQILTMYGKFGQDLSNDGCGP